jgi:hypothetical protein
VFEIVMILEKQKVAFESPSAMVSTLQVFLSSSLRTSTFTTLFLEQCVAMNSSTIDLSTTALNFGNISSSNDFKVIVIQTPFPSFAPSVGDVTTPRDGGSSGSPALLVPLWSLVLIGGVLFAALVTGIYYHRRRKQSDLEIAVNSYLDKTAQIATAPPLEAQGQHGQVQGQQGLMVNHSEIFVALGSEDDRLASVPSGVDITHEIGEDLEVGLSFDERGASKSGPTRDDTKDLVGFENEAKL